ncbi:hypothetical protein HAX54_015164 [Datura stramonium]|uniref:Uncharacterized protein n=1 Tax=Datura stramonium TaxID=4076 RepID=A0ABS8RZ84_DATST|nr:hypothetical protein [Datura stramonium]
MLVDKEMRGDGCPALLVSPEKMMQRRVSDGDSPETTTSHLRLGHLEIDAGGVLMVRRGGREKVRLFMWCADEILLEKWQRPLVVPAMRKRRGRDGCVRRIDGENVLRIESFLRI